MDTGIDVASAVEGHHLDGGRRRLSVSISILRTGCPICDTTNPRNLGCLASKPLQIQLDDEGDGAKHISDGNTIQVIEVSREWEHDAR